MSKSISLPAFFSQVTPEYLDDRRRELDELTSLVNTRDFAEIERRFHKLAGSGGSFGLSEISKLAKQVEHAAQAHDVAASISIFDQYKEYVRFVDVAYEDAP